MSETTNYHLIKYAQGASDWHSGVNENFDIIDSALKSQSDAIANKAPEGHNHNDAYAPKSETAAALTALAQALDNHTHKLEDIEDLPSLYATVSGIPELSVSGTGTGSAIVVVNASVNTTAPIILLIGAITWGSSVLSYQETDFGKLRIIKPDADSPIWDNNGHASLTVKVKAMNPANGKISDEATITVVVTSYNYIDIAVLTDNIVNTQAFIENVALAGSNQVMTKVLAIKQQS